MIQHAYYVGDGPRADFLLGYCNLMSRRKEAFIDDLKTSHGLIYYELPWRDPAVVFYTPPSQDGWDKHKTLPDGGVVYVPTHRLAGERWRRLLTNAAASFDPSAFLCVESNLDVSVLDMASGNGRNAATSWASILTRQRILFCVPYLAGAEPPCPVERWIRRVSDNSRLRECLDAMT